MGDDFNAQLGRAEYHVYVFDRSGRIAITELPFTSLSWNRQIDQYSEASVTISGDLFGRFGEDVRNWIDCWRYEIKMFRNDVPVWCGPITNVEMEANSLVISAADISVWLQHRLIYEDRKFKDTDLAQVASWIINQAMEVDNFPGLHADFTDTGIKGDRDYYAKQYLSASDELDELTRTSVDWTVVNRKMIVGSFEIPATTLPTLVQEHLATDPGISIVGGSIGNGWYVIGGDPPEEEKKPTGEDKDTAETKNEPDLPKTVGIAIGGTKNRELYGVHDRVVTESSIIDPASARQNAKGRLNVLERPPIVLSQAALVPSAPVTVDQLIPGRAMPIMVWYPREIRTVSRIKQVKGDYSPDKVNDLTIDLEPIGTVKIEDSL